MEVLKILENNLKSMKILENKLESMKILENKLESLKLQENRPWSIIDVDEDDDIIDDEDAFPHDLADSDDEDLVNVDDDVDVMLADVARGYYRDGGGDVPPPPHQLGGGCRGKGTRKPNLGGRKAGRLNTRKETRNLELRKITNKFGPRAIRFEWSDKGTLMPLGDHAAHWANLLREIVWEFLMHFRSWHNIPEEWKAGVMGNIRSIRLLTSTKELSTWKASDPDVPRTSQSQIGMRILPFGLILRTLPDRQMESSATREYPSLIQTNFDTHIVDGVFLRDEERLLYEEMLRLQGLGVTPLGSQRNNESESVTS
ncbi:hypothetical protein Tco_1226946 [Tanacetum coccineum]